MAQQNRIQNLAHLFSALASERRLKIIAHLKKCKTATVSEIAEAIDTSIEAASQHLRTLRSAGIVTARRRGKFSTYRIAMGQEELVKGILSRI